MAYRYGNRNQMNMFPQSIEDYIPENDPFRTYDAFVNALDFNDPGMVFLSFIPFSSFLLIL